ncbi:diphosphomevalonate decarboxylase [Pseudomonas palleroniana]|uniref:diphosphomevalonate decarboxylase n=1 Tax=Pseudomonas palleroniana TaxID=191390 RepID=A0A1H5HYD7_9PSED|nr:diphosphomevalonate decarboxylase [Pseudomonas palleroniana]KAB0565701.1 diphosphomevalonate decarboxylase [Pseudomonas palleroniana]PTC31961.1 diphosphomevalonate decarboxylase [Pseudomonas palleroniana]SEE33073.1 diphosphomevalonate decarboxylase [Pseudomonas palleroniana]
MDKISIAAPSNIALVKYWGMSNSQLTLPCAPSLSMTLKYCVSHCTVEPIPGARADQILWKPASGPLIPAEGDMRRGIENHLARLRRHLNYHVPLRIATSNNFPTGAGIASSASGFAAVALAFAQLCTGKTPAADLSLLARMSGSGSAARSIPGGYVLWPANATDLDSPAQRIATAAHWPLADLIAVVDSTPKPVSSLEGHRRAASSPFFNTRLGLLPDRLLRVRRAIEQRDFNTLAETVEQEAIELHIIAMTSLPPIFYWLPATLQVLAHVRKLRHDGLKVCATMDAGPNVHILCEATESEAVLAELKGSAAVQEWIIDGAGDGPTRLDQHLF